MPCAATWERTLDDRHRRPSAGPARSRTCLRGDPPRHRAPGDGAFASAVTEGLCGGSEEGDLGADEGAEENAPRGRVLEEGADEAVVGGLAARAIDGGDGDTEVVDTRRTIGDVAELGGWLRALLRRPCRSSLNFGRTHRRVCLSSKPLPHHSRRRAQEPGEGRDVLCCLGRAGVARCCVLSRWPCRR